ncbi:MAG: 5-methyltetrahydrofolate--homocysteine methyltransferase [Flavobacteriales bacterium]|nr:MAG: 5-methyltetrahydrofolate--homocysteine methyltransferase [Flavobacteriales bacterium]
MKNPDLINSIIKSKVLVLDGAMGTMIQKLNFDESDYRGVRFIDYDILLKGNNDLLSITQPEAILNIHRAYLKAGADIIMTNTFSSTPIAMADYKMESLVYDLNFESAQLAKKAVIEYDSKEKPRFIAGSIGPTNKTASMSPDVNNPGFREVDFDDLADSYFEQISALVEGGVDILFVETVFDTLNAKAALFAIEKYNINNSVSVPTMLSGTLTDASGRTLSGQTLEAFITSVSHINLLSIGLNCSFGAAGLYPYIKKMSLITDLPISVHPNAGLPNEFGEYDQSSRQMQNLIKDFLENRIVNIIGGCCGTTPDHISLISEIANDYNVRNIN